MHPNKQMFFGSFFQKRTASLFCLIVVRTLPLPYGPASATAPIKIAVFDFELDDFSAGAGIAGDHHADLAQLDRVTNDVRQLLAASGRYQLVSVSSAQDDAVKGRWLRQCNGCDAAIARKLGAAQSFVGVVTRISRTDYTVQFQIRDTATGAVVIGRQSGLRIGADYSWNRGAAALIKDDLLN
jgi:hypothetical protein